jgi:hypothetical protein
MFLFFASSYIAGKQHLDLGGNTFGDGAFDLYLHEASPQPPDSRLDYNWFVVFLQKKDYG